jgi:ABC-type multidrug transport system ATPase subunit
VNATLVCDGVTKRFGKVQALRGLTLDIRSGELFALIGPNGCGKTSAIRIILGFYTPDSGTVRVLGVDPITAFGRIGPQMGVMLDQPGLTDRLTAEEYLECYCGLLGVSRSDARDRVKRVLNAVRLSNDRRRLLETFSKGMRQRISLARAILNEPRLLVLDEPFDGIDNESRRDLLDVLRRIAHDNGTTVFLTSHNLYDIDRLSDRVAIVNRGRVIATGSPEALRSEYARSRSKTTVGTPVSGGSGVGNKNSPHDHGRCTHQVTVDVAAAGLGPPAAIRGRLAEVDGALVVAASDEATLEDVYFAVIQNDEAAICCGREYSR